MPRLLATSWIMAMVSSLCRRGGLMFFGIRIFGQIQHLVGNRISNQGFPDKVFRLPDGFGGKRMVRCANADHFVGKQRLERNTVLFFRFGNNGKVGTVLQQQSDRVRLESRYDINSIWGHIGRNSPIAGMSQSKQVWHSTAIRNSPASPSIMRAKSRSASVT